MYCKQCGHELREGAAFCDRCGTAVADQTPQADVIAQAQEKRGGGWMRVIKILAGVYIICILILLGFWIWGIVTGMQLRPMDIHRGAVSTVGLKDLRTNFNLDADKTLALVQGERIRTQGFCVARQFYDSGVVALGLNTNGTSYIDLYVECPKEEGVAAVGIHKDDVITVVGTIIGYDADEDCILMSQGSIE